MTAVDEKIFREVLTFVAAGYAVSWSMDYLDEERTHGNYRVVVSRENLRWSAMAFSPYGAWERLKTAMCQP